MTAKDEDTQQERERSIWDTQAGSYDARTMSIYEEAYVLSIRKARSVPSNDHPVEEIGC